MKKKFKIAALIILLITIVFSGVFYFYFWLPHQKMIDINWLNSASPKEQRDVAHQVLKLPYGNYHDAYLILIHDGNNESIPILLNRLKHFKKDKNFRVCTETHCLKALQKITGKKIGYDYEKWKKELTNK
jgi:hypothetical protein